MLNRIVHLVGLIHELYTNFACWTFTVQYVYHQDLL